MVEEIDIFKIMLGSYLCTIFSNKLGLELCQAHVRLEFGYVELSLDLPKF